MEPGPRHSVSVAGAIFSDAGTHVLLIQRRDNGRWEPPGGILELDESIEEGLRRELREETGIEVEIEQLTGVYKNMTHAIVALVYRCLALSEPLTSSTEATQVAWVPVTDVDKLMLPAYAIRVHDASNADQVHVRAHDGSRVVDPVSSR